MQHLILTFRKWGRGQGGNMVPFIYLFHSIYEAYFVQPYELGAKRIPKDKGLVLVLQTLERTLLWSFPPHNQLLEFMAKICFQNNLNY